MIIQETINEKLTEKDLENAAETYKGFLVPHTKEALYYHQVFDALYPNQYHTSPYYWLPKWVGDAKDPSARTLNVYKDVEKEIAK
jgi:asparagine synthase (glutamine-hydrolysing)